MLDQYRKNCITVGQQVCLLRSDEVRYGTALDVDPEGALVVRFEDGHVENVNSGEVSVRGMYGYV
jgi:BirA family biotin operon repressor/biotin-[acetyl-CoA-carboxylase] ligase